MNNKKIGKKGELIAEDFIKKKGYRIIERNYQIRDGEIDIIAYDNDILVFIEVKTRRSNKYGQAYEAVDIRKQRKIINTSLNYLSVKNIYDTQVRYDIIEVYIEDKIKINHMENAFSI